MQIIIMTSDKGSHCLPGFAYLWRKYFQPQYEHNLLVCGYTDPRLSFNFYQIGKQKDYPVNRWSDALIKVLDNVADDIFMLMLDDYWLVRETDTHAVKMCYDYMSQFQYVLKFDLTTERLFAEGGGRYLFGYHTYNTLGYLDLIKSQPGSPYHMSLWGGLWRRDLLRKVLVPGETAQQIELSGTTRLAQFGDDMLVLGTRQAPVKHANVVQGGQWNQDTMVGLPALVSADTEALKEAGYL